MVTEEAVRFAGVLERMEQVVASRIGAGVSLDIAWRPNRWRRELQRELRAIDVEPLLERIRHNLEGVSTSADVHDVFSKMRARLSGPVDG